MAGARHKQAFISTHRDFDTERGGSALQLLEGLTDSRDAAGQNAIIQVRKDQFETVGAMIVFDTCQERLQGQGEEQGPQGVSLLHT
jgi:hypothetical protein